MLVAQQAALSQFYYMQLCMWYSLLSRECTTWWYKKPCSKASHYFKIFLLKETPKSQAFFSGVSLCEECSAAYQQQHV